MHIREGEGLWYGFQVIMEDLAYLLELVEAIKLDIILSEDEHKLIERNVVFFNGG